MISSKSLLFFCFLMTQYTTFFCVSTQTLFAFIHFLLYSIVLKYGQPRRWCYTASMKAPPYRRPEGLFFYFIPGAWRICRICVYNGISDWIPSLTQGVYPADPRLYGRRVPILDNGGSSERSHRTAILLLRWLHEAPTGRRSHSFFRSIVFDGGQRGGFFSEATKRAVLYRQ